MTTRAEDGLSILERQQMMTGSGGMIAAPTEFPIHV
jgi:hypothetical protein